VELPPAARIHVCDADIHSAFSSRRLASPICMAASLQLLHDAGTMPPASNILHPRRILMNVKRILGFAAVAGLLMIAAPSERAQALSLSSPIAAAAVQDESSKLTTEVRYHHHRGYHHHWGHHRHHWRRHHWHRHYRHHHHRHRHY
jgi:hypothetical protein